MHADNIVTPEELKLMREIIQDLNFSEEQRDILDKDIINPENPVDMFKGISDPQDQKEFFNFAYDLVMVDGHYDKKEFKVMQDLQAIYDENRGITQNNENLNIGLEQRKNMKKHEDLEIVLSNFKDYF